MPEHTMREEEHTVTLTEIDEELQSLIAAGSSPARHTLGGQWICRGGDDCGRWMSVCTHTPATRDYAFPLQRTKRLSGRLEIDPTTMQARWLNFAGIESAR